MMGQPIEWRVNGLFKQDWRLYYNETLVASILTRKYLSLDRDASYDGIPIQMTYDRNHHRLTLKKVNDGGLIGTIENVAELVEVDGKSERMWTLKLENGESYTARYVDIWKSRDVLVRNKEGMAIAKTVCKRTYPQSSKFTLLTKEDPINPWLAALFGQHYSMSAQGSL